MEQQVQMFMSTSETDIIQGAKTGLLGGVQSGQLNFESEKTAQTVHFQGCFFKLYFITYAYFLIYLYIFTGK